MKLTHLPVTDLIAAFGSPDPTPGGGSASALAGAAGAALLAMVAAMPKNKASTPEEAELLHATGTRCRILADTLRDLVDRDSEAYDAVVAAYRLPKASDEEKAARSAAIQSSLQRATQVPLDCAKVCGDVVRLAGRAAEVGNQNVISDAGVGVLAAWAALRSAVLNVNINAPSLKDRGFAEAKLAETQALLAECGPLSEQIHARVQARLG